MKPKLNCPIKRKKCNGCKFHIKITKKPFKYWACVY